MLNTNYIWIGTRKTTKWLEPEQDLFGIIKMIDNKELNNETYEINLFCLDEYAHDFCAFFLLNNKRACVYYEGFSRKNTNISILILGIDVFLAEILNHNQQYRKIKLIYTFLREKSFYSEFYFITYRVILKDFLSLIASYFIGGYTIDTNVYPQDNNSVLLNSHKNFKFVKLKSEDNTDNSAFYFVKSLLSNTSTYSLATRVLADARSGRMLYAYQVASLEGSDYLNLNFLIECWLIYSPKRNEVARFALNYYLNEFSVFIKKYDLYGDLIISSLVNALYQLGEEALSEDNNYFLSLRESKSGLAFVPELNLVKRYQNTHKVK